MRKFILSIGLILGLISFTLKADTQNCFIVCDNGLEMFSWDLDFIKEAKHSIEIAACYSGGTILRELLAAVEARFEVCPELQVYMLTTPVLLEVEDKKVLAHIQKKYPNRFHVEHATNVLVVWPDVTGIDNHVKMMVIDETYFSAGGTNLDQSLCSDGTYTLPRNENKGGPMGSSLPAGVRDQDIVGRGPLAKELRQTFYKLYSIWENYNKTKKLVCDPETFKNNTLYKPLDHIEKPFVERFEKCDDLVFLNTESVKLLIGGPHQKNNVITNEYVQLINEAKEELLIGNLYFCPASPIHKALLDAVNRGVRLTLITNGVSDVAPAYTQHFCWANRVDYVPMFYGRSFHFWEVSSCAKLPLKRTKIYEYYVKDILYHKKMMIVDGRKFVVGSYNLGTKSDLSDYELILVFESPTMAQDAKKVFNKDITFSFTVTPEMARNWYFDPIRSYMGEVQRRFHGLL